MIHKSKSNIDILMGSPVLKSFQDVVFQGNELVMTVVLPYNKAYRTKCPNPDCGKRRKLFSIGSLIQWYVLPLLMY